MQPWIAKLRNRQRHRLFSLVFLPFSVLIALTTPALFPLCFELPAFAQATTAAERKAEADRLLEQGDQRFQSNQFQDALQSWEQALQIYQEIGDRQGEGNALNNIGMASESLLVCHVRFGGL